MDPIITSVGSIVALVIGKQLKSNTNFSNRFIPIVTFVISLLTQIVSASTAHAAGLDLKPLVHNFGTVLWQALLQTLLTTGAHSVPKNLFQK